MSERLLSIIQCVRRHRRSASGQALSEYSLSIALVVVLVIVVLTSTGSAVNVIYRNMITHKSAPAVPLVSVNPAVPLSPNSANLNLALSDGTVVQIQNYPMSTGGSIETVGVDGTTNQYAQSLVTLAAALQNSGKITPAQGDLLRNLANKGFTFATSQSNLLGYLQEARDKKISLEQLQLKLLDYRTKTFLGADPTPAQMQPFIDNPRSPFVNNATGMNQEAIMNAYQAVEEAGLLNDPAVRALVDRSYDEILRTNFAVARQTQVDTLELSTPSVNLPSNFTSFGSLNTLVGQSLQTTQTSSANICTTGNGNSSSGIACVPNP